MYTSPSLLKQRIEEIILKYYWATALFKNNLKSLKHGNNKK